MHHTYFAAAALAACALAAPAPAPTESKSLGNFKLYAKRSDLLSTSTVDTIAQVPVPLGGMTTINKLTLLPWMQDVAAAAVPTTAPGVQPTTTSIVPMTNIVSPTTDRGPIVTASVPTAPFTLTNFEGPFDNLTPIGSITITPYTPSGATVATYDVPASWVSAVLQARLGASAKPTSTYTGPRQSGTVAATPIDSADDEYVAAATIGGQVLDLQFDTGSSDLWVFADTLPSNESSGHTVYSPSKSTSWQNDTTGSLSNWDVEYGDGSWASGNGGYDSVIIGGATATRQAVYLPTAVSFALTNVTKVNGIVGLGFGRTLRRIRPSGIFGKLRGRYFGGRGMAPGGMMTKRTEPMGRFGRAIRKRDDDDEIHTQKSFFENVMPQLDQPLFTVDFRKDVGVYEFGRIDQSKYTGNITYVPISTDFGTWEFMTSRYKLNGKYQPFKGTGNSIIADTGTTLLLVDNSTAQAYYAQVPGSSYGGDDNSTYVYPCNAPLPDFGLDLGDTGFFATLPGSAMTYDKLASNTNQCIGGLQLLPRSDLPFIMGDIMLKQYFAVFDGGKKLFGLAEKPAKPA